MRVGIEKMHAYIPPYYVDLEDLAHARQVDPEKYTKGLLQRQMSFAPQEQDIIVMALKAAEAILTEQDKEVIDQVIVGTESSFDYSKAASTYIHQLLGIQPFARAYEMKEACYGGTAALQNACDYVRSHPERKVLVVTTDISKYGLASSGEVTQGAGAIAILVSNQPHILTIDPQAVFMSTHEYDFWRPEGQEYALVDGQFSNQLYMDVFVKVVKEFNRRHPGLLKDLSLMHFHLPYSKMGLKALKHLQASIEDLDQVDYQLTLDQWLADYIHTTRLNQKVGNIYTGSLFLSLLSTLTDPDKDLSGDKIGLFSYGSGAVGELFVGQVGDKYRDYLLADDLQAQFDRRQGLSVADYETLYQEPVRPDRQGNWQAQIPAVEEGWQLTAITEHQRHYEKKVKETKQPL